MLPGEKSENWVRYVTSIYNKSPSNNDILNELLQEGLNYVNYLMKIFEAC